MKKYLLLIFLLSLLNVYSQKSLPEDPSDSPYELSWAVDAPYVAGSLGLTVLGYKLIQNKEPLTKEELQSMSIDDVFIIDRWAAGNYNLSADELSYIPFHASFALPVLFLLGEDERANIGQIAVLYLESMATAGALFTISAGAVHRSRPLVYSEDAPMRKRLDKDSQRSFFAGHVAATGAATFFFAKVFSDFNPDSWARPYVWIAAAAIPAWVGYLRIESGNHYLTDNLLGYAVGALSGILIPELHKREDPSFSLTPFYGDQFRGLSIRIPFN